MAHVAGRVAVAIAAAVDCWMLLLLCERVHVAAQRHCGAALGLLLRGGDAVFGEGLERTLGRELGVVVEGEDGGFVGSGRGRLVGLWLEGVLLLLLLLLLLHLGLLWHVRLLGRYLLLLRLLHLHLLLGHADLLGSHLCLPEGILSRVWSRCLRVLLRRVCLRHVTLRLLLS
jgi:hypothetical protein